MSNIVTVKTSDLASIGLAFVQYETLTGESLLEMVPEVELEEREIDNEEIYVLTEEYVNLINGILNSDETRALVERRMGQLVKDGVLEVPADDVPSTESGETLN